MDFVNLKGYRKTTWQNNRKTNKATGYCFFFNKQSSSLEYPTIRTDISFFLSSERIITL